MNFIFFLHAAQPTRCNGGHEAPNAQVHRAGATALINGRTYVCAGSGATASSAAWTKKLFRTFGKATGTAFISR